MRRILICFWSPTLWAILIMIACGISGDDLNKMEFIKIPYLDKMIHSTFYIGLTFLLLLGFKLYYNPEIHKHKKMVYLFSVIFPLMYGLLIEILQKYLFIHRGAEFFDLIANLIGIFIGFIIYFIAERFLKFECKPKNIA